MNDAVTIRPQEGASLGRIDQYELIRELGGGGFGCVYLARDTVAGIEVAVKGLSPLIRQNKEELENVRNNFALVSRLHHPNIAAALTLHPVTIASYNDVADAEKLRVFGGDMLVVMQYARGVTLSQWRKQFPDGKVPLDKSLVITRQIASALDYAHEEKILHRDIKPANVMIETGVDGSLTARVLDFGLAAEIRSSMSRVSQSITDTSGTRPYMAPEQWLGKEQGKETDLYALAVLFNELITGKVPFASVFDTGDPVVMMNVVGREAPEISAGLPKHIRRALAKALAKKREDRFESCTAFVTALKGGRASSRAVILVALALLGIGAGAWYWQNAKSKDVVRVEPGHKVTAENAAKERLAREAEEARLKAEREAVEERVRKAELAKIEAERKEAAEKAAKEKTDLGRKEKEEAAERLSAMQKAEADRKAAEAERIALEKAQAEAAEKARKAEEEARIADEKAKADLARKKKEAEAAQVAAEEKARAEDAFRKKKIAEKRKREKMRGNVKMFLSQNDGVGALKVADELVKSSFDVQDGKLWMDAWLMKHKDDVTESERKDNTQSYEDKLADDNCGIKLEALCRMDFSDAKVIQAIGRHFSGVHSLRALAFYEKAREMGVDADNKIAELRGALRWSRCCIAIASGDIMEIRDVITCDNPCKDVVDASSGTTLMHAAAHFGNGQVLDYMESIGYRHDVENKYGVTPFFFACSSTNAVNAVSSIKWFLDRKVDVNAPAKGEEVPPYPIMSVNTLEAYELLLKNGADLEARSKDGRTAVHYWVSSTYTDVALLSKVLNKTNTTEKDFAGNSALHHVGSALFVRIAVSRGADPNTVDNEGKTPLHKAQNNEISKALIECGADVNARDNAGKTPLFYRNDVETMRILVSAGADVNAKDREGVPLLLHNRYNYSNLEFLLSRGADSNQLLPNGNTVFLELFPVYENVGVMKRTIELFLRYVEDINAQDKDGNTALHLTYNPEVALMLLRRGASANKLNNEDKPPLLVMNLTPKVAKVLLENRADPNLKLKKGGTVFTEGFSIFNSDSQEWVKLCVQHGADVNALNWQGYPLVVEEASHISFNQLKFLVEECGANVNAVSKNSQSALCKAAFGYDDDDYEVVRYLVEHGADLFYRYEGRTALQWAEMGRTQMIKEYLKEKMGIGEYKCGDTRMITLPGGATMEMIYCEPGSFQMGKKGEAWHDREHRVTLTNGFWLGKYEVTQSQWKSVMGNNPSKFVKWFFGSSTNCPVENVTWHDCQEFIKKVNGKLACGARLPTEAEWEYACRADTDTNYFWGDTASKSWANYGNNLSKSGSPLPVGSYKPNRWGFHDMHGNVDEWCSDWHDSYPPLFVKNHINPKGPDKGRQRVIRGGNWFNDEKNCCSWYRDWDLPSISCSGTSGFRLCIEQLPTGF